MPDFSADFNTSEQPVTHLLPNSPSYTAAKLSAECVSPQQQAYVDTPQYLNGEWVSSCGGPYAPLARLASALKVCVVGGGAAGIRVAFESVKAGAQVTLIEARGEVGGRCRSEDVGGGNVFEKGAMRFPPSQTELFLLAQAFGYGFIPHFPNPGKVPTIICLKDGCRLWKGETVPEGFEALQKGWQTVITSGFEINGRRFTAPCRFAQWLQSPDLKTRTKVIKPWQNYISYFWGKSWREGLERIFGSSNATPPQGIHWSAQDFEMFGKFGVGSGGFGAFDDLCFLSLFRIFPNRWEQDQCRFAKKVHGQYKPAGIQELWQSIWQWCSRRGLTTRLHSKVIAVTRNASPVDGSKYQILSEDGSGRSTMEFDEAFICVTPPLVEALNLASGPATAFSDTIQLALGRVHMTKATKVFALVSREPFKDDKQPRVILTDGISPQCYILDYGDPLKLVALVTYAWEAYSDFLENDDRPERALDLMRQAIADALVSSPYPNWADHLRNPLKVSIHHWQLDPFSLGAFTLSKPGEDHHRFALFYNSLSRNGPYLCGSAFTPYDGWVEGSQISALSTFSAMARRRGRVYCPELAPVNVLQQSTYRYDFPRLA